MTDLDPETARRIAADNIRIAAENQAHDRACIAAAPDPVFTHWHQVADSVDEGTWQRILNESPPAMRTEYEHYRPPAPLLDRRAAIARLTRAHTTSPLTRKEQP